MSILYTTWEKINTVFLINNGHNLETTFVEYLKSTVTGILSV